MPSFAIGSPIVHPMHGAGVVSKIERREIQGRMANYYVIDFACGTLARMMVDTEMADKVGLRIVASNSAINNIFEDIAVPLSAVEEEQCKSFHKRYREHLLSVQSGNLKQVAGVYRLLLRKNANNSLGAKDKALFDAADRFLVSEIIYAKGVDRTHARELLGVATEDVVDL